MSVELKPERAIVPIVRATKAMPIIEVLGTGFFVGNDSALHVITAKHVITDNPLSGDEKYAIVFNNGQSIKILATLHIRVAVDYDIAACRVDRTDFPDAVLLAIGRRDPSLNEDLFSYEYSSTRIERTPGHTHVCFEPYAHKGHIVRSFDSTYPEKVKTASYLTSFPALQGASGAPLIAATLSKKSFAVVGVTVANVEMHLQPAQVVEIHDGNSYRESTSYFLPYGKALARSVVAHCLEGMQVPFTYAEDLEAAAENRRWWRRLWSYALVAVRRFRAVMASCRISP